MPSARELDRSEQRRQQKRAHYQRNRETEQQKARLCMERQKKQGTPEEQALRAARHREAQARYRERNRLQLNVWSWQHQLKRKRLLAITRDDEEYQTLMALELDSDDDNVGTSDAVD